MKLKLRYNFKEKDIHGLWFDNFNLDDILNRKKKLGLLYGELLDFFENSIDISLSKVSHIIEDLRIIDDTLEVDIILLDTIYGKEAKELIKDGIPLLISPRVIGFIKDDGQIKVKELFTFDITYNNSFVSIVEDPKMRTIRIRKQKLKEIDEKNGYISS